MSDSLSHYGTPRHSGRYPWGSGGNPYQRNVNFRAYVKQLEKEGMTKAQIAKSMGMTSDQLKAKERIARAEIRSADVAKARKLRDKGYSYAAIGKALGGKNESTVRSLLDEARQQNTDVVFNTANALKGRIDDVHYIDIGVGAERYLGVSRPALMTAAAMLEEQGYVVESMKVPQLGTGHFTTVQVLAEPGTNYGELKAHLKDGDVRMVTKLASEDGGFTWHNIEPPVSVDSKRVAINYGDKGGAEKDGVIELRRGVDELSLGSANYAQVRIAVDGTHYLKGMAVYADDLPAGIDIRFNTNKDSSNSKMDVLKPMKTDKAGEIDKDNPFGATIKDGEDLKLTQRHYIGKDGKEHLSAINVVNEEGDWGKWQKTLSSQFLSKQSLSLAKQQLDKDYNARKKEYDEIMSLTNPAVQKKLLEDFAESCDSGAVHLKAAAMPRQTTAVLLPVPSLKETEVYAPNYRQGETVVLVRHPHGGTFEIPTLTVNNRNKDAEKLIGNAPDAICINSKVAERLSGADFDGDSVLVIPNNNRRITTSEPLAGLKDFDPKVAYPYREGMQVLSKQQKGKEMGKVTNLITDMQIKGAPEEDIVKAVRHSMVVIDAEKHKLDYKRSEEENEIAALKRRWQYDPETGSTGAGTLISRASSEEHVSPVRKDYFKIDPKTGAKIYQQADKPEYYTNKDGKLVERTTKSTKMAETPDARKLSSGTEIENVYADYANSLKALANDSRKAQLSLPRIVKDPKAKEVYKNEVNSLNAKLDKALKNAPLERQAQIIANAKVRAKVMENPELKEDKDSYKKVKDQSLKGARKAVGANKKSVRIDITPREWEAIQAGAVSQTTLEKILNNTDMDKVRAYSMPRRTSGLSSSQKSRASAMLKRGATQAEVADALGVSVSLINSIE